jgi:choline dehydrogenase-like flavoprotein
VLASRLTEDSNKTVLVIEAGNTGYEVQNKIDVPGNAYYSSLLNTDYDWQYKTAPQANLGNRVLDWPRGRVLGGSTAVNGLYLVRPSALEVNAWAQLAGPNGTEFWGWDSLFAAMKKSEKFTPPAEEIAKEFDIQYNADSHGTSGPLDYSYPGYLLPIVGDWTTVLENIGILSSPDPNGGQGWGAFVATSSINPTNWTRSYSRSAYIDPLPPRANLHILANTRVMKVNTEKNTDGTVKATGITYALTPNSAWQTVTANKEVILSGGAVGSPHMLLLSGIGPKDQLAQFNITPVVDLPGVGEHLQDHLASQVIYKTSGQTAAQEAVNQTLVNGSSTFLSFVNSAIAYSNITDLFGDYASTFKDEVSKNATWAVETLSPTTDATVRAGYAATYALQAEQLIMSPIGQVELLLGLTGTAQGGDDSVAVQAALQRSFSRGRMYLNNSSPWEYPVIDPNYLAHPADVWLLREGLKLARKLSQTDPFSKTLTTEVYPGPAVSTDAEWDAWLKTVVTTEYHPSGACSMLPLEQGGVVGADLKVHGTSNLRVIDSSVFPIEFAAHLMTITYGLAEKGADLIKAVSIGL